MFFTHSLIFASLTLSALVAANPQPTAAPQVQKRYLAKRQNSDDFDLNSALSEVSDQTSGLDTESLAGDYSSILNDPEFSSLLSQATDPAFLSSALSQVQDPAFSSSLADAVGSQSAAAIISSASAAASDLNGASSGGSSSSGDDNGAVKFGVGATLLVGIGAAVVFAL